MKIKSKKIEEGQIFFGDKNDLIKSTLDKKLIIRMFDEYRQIRPGIEKLSINNLMRYSRDELFYLYAEQKLFEYADNEDKEDNDHTDFFNFERYKNNHLLENPEENPPKKINRKQAIKLILYYYRYHNKKDSFLSNIKSNKVKLIDLIEYIKHNIKNIEFYVEELLKEEIQGDIDAINHLNCFVKPTYMEERLHYEKEINFNFKLN